MKHSTMIPTGKNTRFIWQITALICSIVQFRTSQAEVEFNRDIRPILSDYCFKCHGPDGANRQAELRLDLREDAIRSEEGKSAAIVPGDPGRSEIVRRMLAHDSDEVMPPASEPKKLSLQQIELIKAWIEEGAKYQLHWAYSSLQPVAIPNVSNTEKVQNSIDLFIQSRLEREGFEPSNDADRSTLIRRVTLDLTGLPPTTHEVDDFLADRSPDAYEKVVDRLLNSVHYGERMAVDWLDAARYADTNGYQVDRDREVFAWRDWVIHAFNANLPFDQFTLEQFAGDLLPDATLTQKIATGFHRNHMMNEEGGIIPDEFLAEYLADRVETTAAVWLGQTFNCTRCHDHKYDPFTQRDFYSMKAFFNSVPEPGRGFYERSHRESNPPFLSLPSDEQREMAESYEQQIQEGKEALSKLPSVSEDRVREWASHAAKEPIRWSSVSNLSSNGSHAEDRNNGGNRSESNATPPALRVDPNGGRAVAITVRATPSSKSVTAFQISFTSTDEANTPRWQEIQAFLKPKEGKRIPIALRPRVSADSIALTELDKLFDEDSKTFLPIGFKKNRSVSAVFEFESAWNAESEAGLFELDLRFSTMKSPISIGVSTTDQSTEWLVPTSLSSAISKSPSEWSVDDKKKLTEHLQSMSIEYRSLSSRLALLEANLKKLRSEIPTTLVMSEMDKPRSTHILMRGAYDKPTDEVVAASPSILPPMRTEWPRNRLGLAKWLVDRDNPLTARVTVNRYWQSVFGTGLVRTSEDFGSQGELPSHPDLLDWLSVRFMESGWDVKAMMRLLVTSHTYRQSSRRSDASMLRDPDNRLLSHGPRFRLQAEFVRDQALAVCGLLVGNVGGPSVKPYHPSGLYEQITAGNGTNVYVVGKGIDLYRRSMYTYWKRSVPHPAMLVFDAPFRETCAVRRTRTNTPLQALNLMNDPTFVEASRFLAQRIMTETGSDFGARLYYAYRSVLARAPTPTEIDIFMRAYDRVIQDFRGDAESAQALKGVGEQPPRSDLDTVELAAWTILASTILNLDEAITKE
jgi:hypothetical protein